AADAVARLTGIPGVAIVTAGPGVSNTLTAIKNAQLAQSPVVLIGGATATMLRGRGSLQDIDQTSLMKPHVKWMARPNALRDVVPAMEEAFEQCQRGYPGPVFVELAVDLLYPEHVVREWYAKQTDKPNKTLVEHGLAAFIKGNLAYRFALSEAPAFKPHVWVDPPPAPATEVATAANMLEAAERPLMVIGSQTTLRPHRLAELVSSLERMGIPVYLSGMARGLLGKKHPLQKRHKRRNALKEADVVLLSGVPNDFRLDYGSHVARAKVISVNLSEEDLYKNRRPDVGALCDPCDFICSLANRMGKGKERKAWHETLDNRDGEREGEIDEMLSKEGNREDGRIHPLELCKRLDEHLSDDAILIGDGGDFIATCSYTLSPRGPLQWLDPGVFGTLGVGAGFAIGAKLVRPQSDVWLLYGDGAAGFSIMEHDTMVRHELPIISVIGNDAGWTQIERDQVVILEDDVACRLTYMDYQKVAEGCGAAGIKLERTADIDQALDSALTLSRGGQAVCINALLGKSDFRKGSISI
ncbi:MAG: thiamine pyrophosphate-binding protein, partial [Myxococcales bacterium]|nr:thiamine pyrophosphate-binding protein [Myxococcales bacterium]